MIYLSNLWLIVAVGVGAQNCQITDLIRYFTDVVVWNFPMTYLPLAARVCIALIFLNAGINHLTGLSEFTATIASKNLPLPSVLAIGTVIFQILGAISVIIGFKSKIGAGLLILFLIPATIFFHPPTTDLTGFLRNVSMMGGLLMVIAYGPGLISVDGSQS